MSKTDKPKLAKYFWNELNAEHHRNSRGTRCIVPGKQKPLIVCPECNKCSNCPFGRKPEDRQPRVIDYEVPKELMNNNDDFSTMNQSESEMIYEELIAAMRRKDPLIAEVFTRYHTYDYDAPEIAAELGIDKRKVYYLKHGYLCHKEMEQNRKLRTEVRGKHCSGCQPGHSCLCHADAETLFYRWSRS